MMRSSSWWRVLLFSAMLDASSVYSCSSVDVGIDMCGYESHSVLLSKMRRLADTHPSLAKVIVVGRSVRNRPLAALKISANVTSRAPLEPMFKFVGNMHGDETLGRQLLLYLSEYLLKSYTQGDPRVRRLLDTTEIYLMPTMNPDGFEVSSEGCGGLLSPFRRLAKMSGRENANGKDLNRDFPKQFDEPRFRDFASMAAKRQPETVALMRWILNQPFVLSANMHGGAVVASFPFDDSPAHRTGVYSRAPDDNFFRFAAATYSDNHAFMHKGDSCSSRLNPFASSERFDNGITNGAKWYDVPGGMQDFNYVYSNAFEITLELSCCKHVPARTLAREWFNNKEAMLRYMELTHSGIKGYVVDAQNRAVERARVYVDSIKKAIDVTSSGEYWRLLAPGHTYVVYADAPGYARSERITVNVPDLVPPQAVIVNFVLNDDSNELRRSAH